MANSTNICVLENPTTKECAIVFGGKELLVMASNGEVVEFINIKNSLNVNFNQEVHHFLSSEMIVKYDSREIKKEVKLLMELEWSVDKNVGSYCPVCDSIISYGHKKDCQLAAVLKENGISVIYKE